METFLTIKEFATSMAVHENTVRNMIKAGRINAFRLSDKGKGHWRIPQSEGARLGLFSLNKLIGKEVEKEVRKRLGMSDLDEKTNVY